MELPILHIPGYLDKVADYADKILIETNTLSPFVVVKLHFGDMFPGKLKQFHTILSYLYALEKRNLDHSFVCSVPIVHNVKETKWTIFDWLQEEVESGLTGLNIGKVEPLKTVYDTTNGGTLKVILSKVDLENIDNITLQIKGAVTHVLVALLLRYEYIQNLTSPIITYSYELEDEYTKEVGYKFQLSIMADKYETIISVNEKRFDIPAFSEHYQKVTKLADNRNVDFLNAKTKSDLSTGFYHSGINMFKVLISKFLKADHEFFYSKEGELSVNIMNTVVNNYSLMSEGIHSVPGTGFISIERLKEVSEKCKKKNMLPEYQNLIMRLSSRTV